MNFVTRFSAAGTLLLASSLAAPAHAGNIGISEFDSTSSGRGFSTIAVADSPSAIIYNPANITRLPGLQLNFGMAAMMPRWEYVPLDDQTVGTKSETAVSTPPSFSLTYNLGNPGGIGDIAAGLGFYVPWGSSFSWPAEWAGRQSVQKITLQIFEVSPVLAWRPHPMVAVGAGLRVMPGNVYLKQAVDFGTEAGGTVEMAGSGTGMGASAGIGVWPLDGLSLGFSWRSAGTVKMTGQSDFDFPAPFDTKANDRDVETEVPVAQMFRAGVAYDVLPKKLNVSAAFMYQMWSTFKELAVTFIDADGNREVLAQPRNAKNSVSLHLGGEYRLSDSVAVRAGYVYDQKVLPEDTVNPAPPNSDLHLATVGASYYMGQYGVHAHFENVFYAPRESKTSSFPAKWQGGWAGGTMAYVFGLNVSAAFGAAPEAAAAPAPEETSAVDSAPAADVSPATVETLPASTPEEAAPATTLPTP